MNCQRFENVVSDLARGQMMEADVREEALTHSDECEDCAVRLRDEERLTRGLKLLAAEMKSLAAPGEMELGLCEAFRRRQVVVPVLVRQGNSRYWLAAVAAILLLVISVVAVNWRSNKSVTPHVAIGGPPVPEKIEERSEPQDKPANEAKYVAENPIPKRQGPGRARPSGLRRPNNAQVANHVTNEIATEFMPLGYMNAANLQDGGQIVRVVLPRSALASFGLPVNMDRFNEKVKADVLLGVDGLAHAIRFVQ